MPIYLTDPINHDWHTLPVDNDDFALCLDRERWLEALAAERLGHRVVELRIERQCGVIEYDLPDDLAGQRCLLRCSIDHFDLATSDALRAGAKLVESRVDALIAQAWLTSVDRAFLHREIDIFSWRQISPGDGADICWSALEPYADEHGRFFVKTFHKSAAGLATLNDFASLMDALQGGPYNFRPETSLIVSQPMLIATDEVGPQEWRYHVANHTVVGRSRYIDYPPRGKSWTWISANVDATARDFAETHRGKLPPNYVVDLASLTTGDAAVVELNGLSCAGRYLDFKPAAFINAYLGNPAGADVDDVDDELRQLDDERLAWRNTNITPQTRQQQAEENFANAFPDLDLP